MKKRTLGLFLALVLALILPSALAEETYTPGEITKELFQTSYDDGAMIGGDLYGTFSLPDGMFEEGSEDQAFYDALQNILNTFGLNVGVGKLDNGLRLELAGLYAPEDGDISFLGGTHALNLTEEGISIESSLLEGDRITVKWDTLLELAGIPMTVEDIKTTISTAQETIAPETVLENVAEAQNLLMPYAITFADFLMTLDMEEENNVEADGIFPAVDHELTIRFTTKDAARLCTVLSEQISKDKALQKLVPDVLLLAQELQDFADDLADSDAPVQNCMLLVGYCDDGLPMHTIFMADQEDGTTLSELFILTPSEDEENAYSFYADFYIVDENENILEEVEFDSSLALSLDDPSVQAIELNAHLSDNNGTELNIAFENEAALTDPDAQALVGSLSMTDTLNEGFRVDYQWINKAFDAEGQPGFGQSLAFALSFPDDPSILLAEGAFTQNLTENAGETTSFYMGSSMQFDEDEAQDLFDLQAEMLVEPSDDGFQGQLIGHTSVLGLTPGVLVSLYPWEYDPASSEALNEIKLEELSMEEMDALMVRVQEALMNDLNETVNTFAPETIEDIQTLSNYGSMPEMVE